MSQPKQYAHDEEDPQFRPIQNRDDLIDLFVRFEKPRSAFRVGVEHERFVMDKATLRPAPFFGSSGIEQLLKDFCNHKDPRCDQLEPAYEGEHVVALMGPKASVTLEPGGQFELSGAPYATVHEIDADLSAYEETLGKALESLGLCSLLMGFHPWAKRDDFQMVPKARYDIMYRTMPKVGTRGHDMMLRTCTVQANMDYASEKNMVDMVRVGLALSPVITGLFGASPFFEGHPSGNCSERSLTWNDTDPARSGFVAFAYDADFGYAKWVEWVLDVPMYFIRRNGAFLDATGQSFRTFMREGFNGHTAMVRDFTDHLTTVFTEVRIKPQIEVRSADCLPGPFLRALPAFWKGVLYDETALEMALQWAQSIEHEQLKAYQTDAARRGLLADFAGRPMWQVAQSALEIAQLGLRHLGSVNHKGEDETKFLNPLFELVQQKQNVAQRLIADYNTRWDKDVYRVLKELR